MIVQAKNPGPSKIPLCGEGPGIGFTPEGCPINFTTCSWNSGIVEYWIIGSKNEILPIEMIKGFIRLMKPILFLSSIIPSLHYSSYSIFTQSQLPMTWPIEDPAMRGRTRFSGFK